MPDISIFTDVIAPVVLGVVTIPLAFQYVNIVSGRIQASRLQEQINENNAVNNTSSSEDKQIAKS